MTQLHSFTCRKRCRSNCEEESSEFTPLSKRINNLHINNTLLSNNHVGTIDSQRNCEDEVNALHQLNAATNPTDHLYNHHHNINLNNCNHLIDNGIIINGDSPHHSNWNNLNHNINSSNHNPHTNDVSQRVTLPPQPHPSGINSMTHTDVHNSQHLNNAQHVNSHLNESMLPNYNPDLSPSENPYYYENNRLLFSLYIERLQRNPNSSHI